MSADNQLDAQKIVEAAETGGRSGVGFGRILLLVVPFCWALFQLWYASPLPFMLDFGIVNDTEARSIHLAFATFLAFAAFPASKKHLPADRVPLLDWLLALIAAFASAYLFLFYDSLAMRSGAPTGADIVIAVVGVVLLLEATRRSLGLPLTIIAAIFIFYTFAGPHMPDVIAHKGASLQKAMSHLWLTTEGVFGVALGVSTSFVFLFVLFGALMERAGAGSYFIRVAYAVLGHLQGGPAKAAVVSSGLSGMVSGSSIANVVTTGTFTIPLMKRSGFSAVKSGAVEVAASTNGQLTPPIMGAAAFLISEYVGIPYLDVVKAALLPALISYIALFYIVHLEAVKLGLKGIPRERKRSFAANLLIGLTGFIIMCVLTLVVYYGLGWIKVVAGDHSPWVISILILVAFVLLTRFAARYYREDADEMLMKGEVLPPIRATIYSGLHFLLPVVLLLWCLVVERYSPALSAFWATVLMLVIVFLQPLVMGYGNYRGVGERLLAGLQDCAHGMTSGARNMVGIGVATATAGIVVGTVTLTGIGLVMTEFVELVSGGNLFLMLLFTAVISLILGMGLPTTANYIVVSTLMAPVIVTLGAASGLVVPLIAVHLFVFYFGILADDTPPVGLAAYAAAAISGGDPVRTGLQGFSYDIRTAILPFMFIFNTELLLIGIESGWALFMTVSSATIAMLAFSAAIQGYWLTRSRLWESICLLLIAFSLFRPGFWWDRIHPPLEILAGNQVYEVIDETPAGETLKIWAEGETLDGDWVKRLILLELPEGQDASNRLADVGLELRKEDDELFVDSLTFGSLAEQQGMDFDWEITGVERSQERPSRYWVFLGAGFLLGMVGWSQVRRRRR